MDAGSPTLEWAGGRATLRLHRPAQANRIEPGDLAVLHALFDAVDAEPEARVLVLAAEGRTFSAGYHLGDLEARPEDGAAATASFARMVDRLEAVRVPTVARLQGGVHGGSTDLVLACDFRIAAPGFQVGMPAAALGVHYYAAGMRRYVSRLGLNQAKRLFLTAARLDAEEALRIGYLTELAPEGGLDAAVDALADRIAALAPLAVQGMKQALNEIARGALDEAALRAREVACKDSADLREGLAAFRAKRAPAFTGR